MNSLQSRSISVDLSIFTVPSGKIGRLNCQDCESPLDIHQPDSDQPGRLLGTCPGCGLWYRIDPKSGSGRALVIRLPEPAEIRELRAPPVERA